MCKNALESLAGTAHGKKVCISGQYMCHQVINVLLLFKIISFLRKRYIFCTGDRIVTIFVCFWYIPAKQLQFVYILLHCFVTEWLTKKTKIFHSWCIIPDVYFQNYYKQKCIFFMLIRSSKHSLSVALSDDSYVSTEDAYNEPFVDAS